MFDFWLLHRKKAVPPPHPLPAIWIVVAKMVKKPATDDQRHLSCSCRTCISQLLKLTIMTAKNNMQKCKTDSRIEKNTLFVVSICPRPPSLPHYSSLVGYSPGHEGRSELR